MKHLILFILVTTYFRLHEACEKNRVLLHNELGPGRILEFHCYSLHNDLGVKNLNFNAPPYVIEFHDDEELYSATKWNCSFRQGTHLEYYYDVEVYNEGDRLFPRCGQLRVWTTIIDGIYFTRKLSIPSVLALRWKKI
ncbi:hypothetical protein F2Q69_00040025 [Brassica cretica]|uniref:S-protein homolog n=1 Tax=Brassica cretica TaxID=69181 RepID=A0A8S9NNU4_BRACR|nr:hypothetical protein F2Q69_00040025 [Brassica cretica]